jgi:hypothetical protein
MDLPRVADSIIIYGEELEKLKQMKPRQRIEYKKCIGKVSTSDLRPFQDGGKAEQERGIIGEKVRKLTIMNPEIICFTNSKFEKLWILIRQVSETSFETCLLDIAEDGSLFVNEVSCFTLIVK